VVLPPELLVVDWFVQDQAQLLLDQYQMMAQQELVR
jgi:hypothetical protein